MNRKFLKPFLNKKVCAEATVERYGLKSEYRGGDTFTVLVKDITLYDGDKSVYIDHAWMKVGKTIAQMNLPIGSHIRFNCHVKEYLKGYVDRKNWIDWRHVDIGINRASAITIIQLGNGKNFHDFYTEIKNQGKYISLKYQNWNEIRESVSYYKSEKAEDLLLLC